MNQSNSDQDDFRKKAVIPVLLGMYIMLIFLGLWETADDLNDIRRLIHYKGTISSFKCYKTEANRGPNSFVVNLSVS
ncbi:hypothetical protein GCM10007891_09590 [Methylophaga thalassica]|uniref:Uncharacterized protein n=1 Tax=Methylophaga thalassica TaxID=40223 RepID=A0ABQ5TTJ3_9GAMM|nr:hypothetical protein GCM10007891_09590 [Methylophaga thalassica]